MKLVSGAELMAIRSRTASVASVLETHASRELRESLSAEHFNRINQRKDAAKGIPKLHVSVRPLATVAENQVQAKSNDYKLSGKSSEYKIFGGKPNNGSSGFLSYVFKEKDESPEDSIGPLKILSPPGDHNDLKKNAQPIPDQPALSGDLDLVRRETNETKTIQADIKPGLAAK